MILSRRTVSLFGALIILSILIANFLNIIATDHNFYLQHKEEGASFTNYLSNKYGPMTDSPRNLIWFLQISDIHISIFRDAGRISQFQQFCDNTVKRVKPIVVLASGDLTDAKTKDNLGSSQVVTEWVYYYNIIKESGVTKDTIWLDIRGNHDNFNIKSLNSQENFFRNYSVQGSIHTKSYINFVNRNGINVAFLGIDACPEPGLKRPFNFIGMIDAQEQQNLLKLKFDAEKNADHLVWFAHYPTSCVISLQNEFYEFDLRQLVGNAQNSHVYVCGHLHSMGGAVTKMYTKQKKGYLELELGDWKDNRMFRLAAIDHGMFSFVDQRHNTWPLVLVTNPKHAQYVMPGREPLDLMLDSTHIRILAFSDVDIDTVQISFDKISWMKCVQSKDPLYVCKWLPNLFKNGLHYMHVAVTDKNGKTALVEHPFSLDGSPVNFPLIARILLMLDATVMFQAIFATVLMVNVLPLVALRMHKRPPRYYRGVGSRFIRSVWLLTKIDRVFYPIVLYAAYLPFGPWAIGNLIDDHIGVIFAWGIVIKGAFLPEPFTYMYGSIQLVLVQLPLILVLAYSLQTRLYNQNATGVKRLIRNLPFIFLFSIQLLLAYFFWLEYGTVSFMFGPLRSWSVFLSVMLWYKIMNLPPEYCRKLINFNETSS